MLVSSRPWTSVLIRIKQLVIDSTGGVSPESLCIDDGRIGGPGGELLSRHPPVAAQWDQLSDGRTVAGDDEGLPMRHRIHDLSGTRTKISLSELMLASHVLMVPAL